MTWRLVWSPDRGDRVAEWRHLHSRGLRRTVAAAVALGIALAIATLPGTSWSATLPVAVVAGGALGLFLIWRLPHLRVQRAEREGRLPTGEVVVEVSEGGVHLARGAWTSHLAWPAIEGVASGPRHIHLHLSDVQVISVPRRVLGDAGDEARFVAEVRAWQRRGNGARLPSDPDPGRDLHVLRFHLHEEDYVLFARVVHRRQLKRRPLRWTLMGLLIGALLLASAEPWRGPVDPMLLALMGGFSGLLTVVGLAPLWYPALLTPVLVRRGLRRSPGRMPSGEVVLGAGPAGGWMRSTRGVSRFGWREVREVYSDAEQVLVLFSDRLGVIIPARAFTDIDQDAFVAAIESWRSATGWRTHATPPGPRSSAPTGVPDPFAPPEG